jgi:hypothetical protein
MHVVLGIRLDDEESSLQNACVHSGGHRFSEHTHKWRSNIKADRVITLRRNQRGNIDRGTKKPGILSHSSLHTNLALPIRRGNTQPRGASLLLLLW